MKYFNCHAHVFNNQYVPEKFLKVQLSERLANVAHWVLNRRYLAGALLWILKKLPLNATTKKTIAFISVGFKKTQDLVFDDLVSKYPKEDDVRFILLPVDFTFMGAGKLDIPYTQQLADLFEVKKKFPDRCYPFVAIDPRSGSAAQNADFVTTYIKKGFAGIKLYPALGYFGFDKGLELVYQQAQQYEIPIMTHCSTGGIYYVDDKIPGAFINPDPLLKIPGKNYFFPKGSKKNRDYCDQFNDPENFREALTAFPKLKICFAHFGLNAANKTGPKVKDKEVPLFEWLDTVIALMEAFPNVYTDISYSVAYQGFCEWFLLKYQGFKPELQDRIMFGTDYFMTISEEFGDDDEIIENVRKKIPADIFSKIAFDNVLSYLKSAPIP